MALFQIRDVKLYRLYSEYNSSMSIGFGLLHQTERISAMLFYWSTDFKKGLKTGVLRLIVMTS